MYFPNQGGKKWKPFYFLEINTLSHLLSMKSSFPDSSYAMKDTQRKTLGVQWIRFSVSHHWGHQRNASTFTLDTKFPIPHL